MNTRRAFLLVLIAGLLGLHTVYTRTATLDYSLRTGQLYANVDRLKEQRRELEVNLSILRQPVMAAEKASQYCPQLEPANPELEAYHLSKDRPVLPVPSLRAMRQVAKVANASNAGDSTVSAPVVNVTPANLAPDVVAEELDDAPVADSATVPAPLSAPSAVDPSEAAVPVLQPGAAPVSGATHVH